MLSTGVSLGILSYFGALLIWKKMPHKARKWLIKHNLFTDVSLFLGVYFIFGNGVTSLIAAAVSGIMVSASLEVANHPDDYLFLIAAKDEVKKHTRGFSGWLANINREYKRKLSNEEAGQVIDITREAVPA